MSFFNIQLGDVKEPQTVEQARHRTQIISAEHDSEGGKNNIRVSIGFPERPEAQTMAHYVGLPKPGEDANKTKFKLLNLKRFMFLYRLPLTDEGFDIAEWPGAEADANVRLEEIMEKDPEGNYTVATGRHRNSLVLPFLPDEGSAGTQSTSKPRKR